jgi:hypothetical protein
MVTLNIGLNDKDTQKQIDINFARDLSQCTYSRLEKSDTELTLICAVKNEIVTTDYLNNLVEKLNQDCIAVKFDSGNGILFHNKNANKDWGRFNNEYFIPITKTGGMPNNFYR